VIWETIKALSQLSMNAWLCEGVNDARELVQDLFGAGLDTHDPYILVILFL